MPNHVISTVEILGNETTIKKLKEAVREVMIDEDGETLFPFSFNKIIPMPPQEKENWYEWNKKNWGTKWNAYNQPEEDDIEILEGRNNSKDFIASNKSTNEKTVIIRYSFSTAWSPVTEVIKKLSEMFPDTKIKYAFLDEGFGFGGYEYFHDGDLVKSIEGETDSELKRVEKYVVEYGFEEGVRDFEDIYKDMKKVFK
jgi:hypothetical protein